jgi:PAS domain S-box-containing protein
MSDANLANINYALDRHAIVAVTDARGRIIYVNDKFCEISQYAREELLGQDHRVINSGYHPPEFFCSLWRTIAKGQVWRNEIRNRARDGSFYWVDTTIAPVLDEGGKPYRYVSIRNDITERKRLETEIARAAKLSLMGELAASLAHEIKNPLAGIQGAVDILIGRREPGDAEREVLESVRHEVSRIDGLVRQMLGHVRPRSISLQPSPLAETVRRAVQLGQQTVFLARQTGGVTVSLEVLSEDLILPLDAAQMEDAVLNLILNAIAAAAAKGAEGRVTARLSHTATEALIAISDNGPGLSPSDKEHIFKPFFTTKADGTGLGLPAARRIARAHGGRVEVHSQPGQGATFTIHLPLGNSA